jgi:hypothetical protein
MNKESPFSSEYEISNVTELSTQEMSSKTQDNTSDGIRKHIESDYNLNKPRRELISARIISE